MKLFVSFIIFTISQLQLMYAQPVPADQVPRLPEIKPNVAKEAFDVNSVVENLKNTFSQIDSFAFSEQRTRKNEVYWALCWKEIGNKYYYEFVSDNTHLITAYDGKRRSALSGNGGNVFIKNGDLPRLVLPALASPLDLYSFLNIDDGFLSLNELRTNSSIWKNLPHESPTLEPKNSWTAIVLF